MSGIPSLAEQLAGVVPPRPSCAPTRVHRLRGDVEDDAPPRLLAPTKIVRPIDPTGETAMPKPKKAAPIEPAAEPKRRGRKPGVKLGPRKKIVGAARFVIDDRGGMEIRDGQQVIQLERDDVKRLAAFLGRTKGIAA